MRKSKVFFSLVTFFILITMTTLVQAAPITLKVQTVWGGDQKTNLDRLFSEYSKVNPDVKIEHFVVAGAGAATYQEVLQTAFASGTGPDIYFEWGGELSGFFVDSGFAEPLERYYKQYNWNKVLIPWAIDAVKRHGKIYGVPISTHGMSFWYRKDIWKKLGLAEPKTYEELEVLNGKVKNAGIYPLSLGGKYDWMTMRLLDYLLETSCGPRLFDQLRSLKVSWDSPQVVRAFKMFRKWVDNWITPGFLTVDPAEARMPVYQGSALMVFEGSWLETTLIADGQDPNNWDFFIHPTGHKPNRISGFPEQFMISSKSSHKDEAAKFINWLIQKDIQQRELGKAFNSTATIGVFPDKEKMPSTYKWRQTLTSFEAVYPPTDQVFKSDLLHDFFEVQDGMVAGKITPEEGAKRFQEAVVRWKATK